MSVIDEKELAALRQDYSQHELSKSAVMPDPFEQFAVWFNEAMSAEIVEPNAMTLSTAGASGLPTARVVLLKVFGKEGFVFFTNYSSDKAKDLAENPNCTISFFWKELERQAIIGGSVTKVSDAESEEYFSSRPYESKIGALASHQSTVLESREVLENKFSALKEKYPDGSVPRPEHWGGYRVVPVRFEFWQGRASRLHDRIVYTLENGSWTIARLSP